MKYKLIASDMDGTLLNDDSIMTDRNKNAINKAVDAGVLFVTATGRPFRNTRFVCDALNKDMPFIVLNGAEVFMGKSEKLLFERFLDYDLAMEVFELGQTRGAAQIVWTGPHLWTNRECDETLKYKCRTKSEEMSIVTDLSTIRDKVTGISKILWVDDPENVKVLSDEMNPYFGDKLTCASSLPHLLEFIGNNSGKGAALADVGKLYNIDKSEMIAVGDAYNDVCMIKYAGLGVAVDNAPDDIKAVSDYVTVSNNDDAIADIIEKFVL